MGTDDTDSLSTTFALLGRPRRLGGGAISEIGDWAIWDISASATLFRGRPLGLEVEGAAGVGVDAGE